jgi:hypothetical protein|tara:strand:- start:3725 stop:4252 length:528 start_codon:yes stop_codon:yes gene_type:complete
MNQIGNLAASIYDTEFGYADTELARERDIVAISGWLIANEGLLNVLIYTQYSGGNPGLHLEEQEIFKQLYLSKYYRKSSRDVLRNITTDAMDWTRLSEGDTTIQRTNKNETAKTYISLAKEADERIKDLVYSYNLYQARPLQVAGADGGYATGSGMWPPNYMYPYNWQGYPYSRF